MQDSRVLDQLLAATRDLYSLPTVAVRVLELTSSPTVDSTQLKNWIEQDPALTAKLLRVVNSSLFGLSSQIADLGQAITLLGIKPLKLLVLGFCLPEGLFRGVAGPVLSWYWRRSLTKAVAAREVCRQVLHRSGDEAFVVGLLADLGLLAFVQAFGEPYVHFVDRVHRHGNSLEEAERNALGFGHRQFTCRMIEHWKLPEKLCRAIAENTWHAEGASTTEPPSPLGLALHHADLLTHLLCDEQWGVLGQLLECDGARLNEPQLNELTRDIGEKVEQLAPLLNIELAWSRDYSDVLAEARRQLALVAADAAVELAHRSATQLASVNGGDEEDHVRRLAAAAANIGTRPTPARLADRPETSDENPAVSTLSPISPRESLHVQLQQAILACRESGAPLSLLIVETALPGPPSPEASATPPRCEGFLMQFGVGEKVLVPLEGGRLAIGLMDCDRAQVSELARELSQYLATKRDRRKPMPVYLGAATVSHPAPNFDVGRLIEAAERCCKASHTASGAVLKSIEIF